MKDSLNSVLRMPQVMVVTGLSRTSIWRRLKEGDFPRPIRLGPNAVGWKLRDIELWIETRSVVE